MVICGSSSIGSKVRRITPIISTLYDKQNERSSFEVSSTGSKVRIPIISTLYDKQNEWSSYEFSSTDSKVRTPIISTL